MMNDARASSMGLLAVSAWVLPRRYWRSLPTMDRVRAIGAFLTAYVTVIHALLPTC